MVKQLLSQKQISFEERDVSRNREWAQELVNSTGQMGVPVTVYDKDIVVGFDRPRLEQLAVKVKSEEKPVFGAAITDASAVAVRKGSGTKTGAFIGRVKPGSVAERIGLAADDIVTKINQRDIENAADMERALAGMVTGMRISVTFIRGDVLKKGETSV